MSSKFGFLSKINFLQDFASIIIAGLNPAIVHNLEKYMAIKKVHYLSAIEDIEGDYIEFGVYTGSSFCHSIRCVKKLAKINSSIISTSFYGFDSFQGFGKLSESEKHSFYTDINFETEYKKTFKRVNRILPSNRFELVDGFFEETLKSNPKSNLAKIVFIDSDTYSSARLALNYLRPTIQKGTIIILDDYFSYKGLKTKGVCGAFQKFIKKNNIFTRTIFSYGMGGVVKIII